MEDSTSDVAAVKPIEKWAEQKGLWPHVIQAAPQQVRGMADQQTGTMTVNLASITPPRLNPEYWKFAAAKALRNWPEGREVSEADFDAAVADAAGVVIR